MDINGYKFITQIEYKNMTVEFKAIEMDINSSCKLNIKT